MPPVWTRVGSARTVTGAARAGTDDVARAGVGVAEAEAALDRDVGMPLGGAAARGERVVCQLLGWAGADDSLVRVRIIHSTVPSYRTGMVGLVQRQRLIPVLPRRADAC